MTTKEFVNKYKKVYTSLINDPDIKETENKTREEVASEEAQQRVKQSINNEKALSMAAELSSVEKFTNFVTKQDVDLDDIIYGTPSRSHLKRMKKPVELFDLKLEDLNIKEPHPNSSKEVIQELRTLQDQTKNVDDDLKEIIDRQDEDVLKDLITYCDKNNLDYDKDFLDEVIKETAVYINHLKYKFNRPRPRQLGELVNIPIIQQKGKASNTPSYPSGHSIQARIIALFLGREHPKHREELLKLAEEIGVNRIRGGFHYTSDHEVGRLVANDLWANLLKKVRSMKKAFGSDPMTELIKDYMEDRKKKWGNITKIGNFVTDESLQKDDPSDNLKNEEDDLIIEKVPPKPKPEADPLQEAIDKLGPKVQELYENSYTKDERKFYSLEDFVTDELKTKKTPSLIRRHVIHGIRDYNKKKADADAKAAAEKEKNRAAAQAQRKKEAAEKKKKEDDKQAEKDRKKEERVASRQAKKDEEEKQRQDTISSYTERISNIGASERIEETFGKPLERMTQAELDLAGSELESAEKNFKVQRDKDLHNNRFLPPTEPHKDMSLPNEIKDKDKADLKKLKDAIGKDYGNSGKMRKILESELHKLMSLTAKYGEQINPRSETYNKEFAEEVSNIRNSVDILAKEGERLGERSLKRKAAGKLIGRAFRGNWLPEKKKLEIIRDYIEIQNKHVKEGTLSKKDMHAEINAKTKDAHSKAGFTTASYTPTSDKPDPKRVEQELTEKYGKDFVGARATEKDKNLAGKTQFSTKTGAPQMYVPGRGGGWTNIGTKKDGIDPAKRAEAQQKVIAWKKEHGIKDPIKERVKKIPSEIRGKGETAIERVKDNLKSPKVSALASYIASGVARVGEEAEEDVKKQKNE